MLGIAGDVGDVGLGSRRGALTRLDTEVAPLVVRVLRSDGVGGGRRRRRRLRVSHQHCKVENLVHKKIDAYNDKVTKSVGMMEKKPNLPLHTSVRGGFVKNKCKYEPLNIDKVKECEIMITAYGFLVSQIQYNKGWCCVCREFPYALPEPKSLTKEVKKLVNAEVDGIMKEKFQMPTPEDFENAKSIVTSLRGSQGGSDIESGDKSATL